MAPKTLPPVGFTAQIDADLDALRHPDYLRMFSRWRMQWDFWRGGINVLAPDWPATSIRWGVPIVTDDDAAEGSGGLDPEQPRSGSAYEWRSGEANSYLWKHPRETLHEYQERQARQDHLSLFQSIVNIFVSGILLTGAEYKPPVDKPPWSEYHANADLVGTDFSSFVRQALSIAIAMGRCHAITDRPSSGAANSRLEEEHRGDRTYSYLITPLELVDWELDDKGRFIWAKVREVDTSQDSWRSPTDETLDTHWQYRVWHRDWWELFRSPRPDKKPDLLAKPEDAKWFRAEAAFHSVGEVPIATLYAGKDGRPTAMDTESPLSDVADADRKVLNRQSELDELERSQAFALLAIPETESGPAGGVDIGPFRAFTYPSEAGAPDYVSPDQQILAGKAERIANSLHVIRQLAGAGRGRAEFSKEERSAASLTLESSEKQNLMAWWAGSTQEFDIAVHRQVAKWEGNDNPPVASYDRNFDLRTVSSQIADLVQLAQVKVLTPVLAALSKPIVARILRVAGVSEDQVDAALVAIDEEAEKEPAVVPILGQGPPPGEEGDDDAGIA